MADVVVERRRDNTGDRAYVRAAGRPIGYRDLATGAVHCPRAADVGVLMRCTDDLLGTEPSYPIWRGRGRTPASLRARQTRRLLPDRDLATRRTVPRTGPMDEVSIAKRLLALPSGWRGLHAVPVGTDGRDVDHLVVGPGGVFTVDMKHHREDGVWVSGDTIKVNGRKADYVANSRVEAQRAAKLLDARAKLHVPVRGVVAVVGAHGGFAVQTQPADGAVVVLRLRSLPEYLRAQPAVLEDDEVRRVFEVARHLATWQPSTVAWSDFQPS
jgi:Nuclease-related domain